MTVPGAHRTAEFLSPSESKANFTPTQMPQRRIAPAVRRAMPANARGEIPVAGRGLHRRCDALLAFLAPNVEFTGPSPGDREC
jgi:hypothetical protein